MSLPALRFPEFDREWEEMNFCKFLTPNFRDVPKPTDKYLAIGIRSHGKGTFQKPNSEPEKIAMDTLYVVRENDLIVNITFAWEGAIAIVPSEDDGGHVSHRFPTYEFRKDLVFHEYFRSVIADRRFRQKLELISPGGAGRNRVMSKPEFLKLKHRFPTLPEQKKIAEFLGAVDAKIAALRARRDGLVRYKRGLMQALFSRRLRLTKPDGSAFPDWEEKRLGKVAKIYDGTHQTPKYVADGVPFFSVEQVTANNFERTKFIAKDVFEKEAKRVILERNDILMTRIGDIGTCRLIDWDVQASFYVSLALVKSDNVVNSSFLNQFMNSVLFQKELWKRTIHVAFPKKINLGEIGNCMVQLPHHDEQAKIADTLSAIDAKIAKVSDQVAKMEVFKKGLLQQMFV